ncbi:MAG: AMP-binding protein [Mycobacteriales bacterium]
MNVQRLPVHSGRTVPGWFAGQVRAEPAAVAVVAGDLVLSYADLDRWAESIAVRLDERGVGPGDTVALCLPRSAAYLAALFGVLRVGAAALLLNPQDPVSRLRMVLEGATPVALLAPADGDGPSRSDLADAVRLPITVDSRPPVAAPGRTRAGPAVDPDGPAIVVATSGSTGRPKSVVLSHRACCAGIDWARRTFELTPADRHLFKTSVSFVSVLRHVLWPLLTGGATVVVPPGEEANLPLLAALVQRHRVSTTTFIPSSFRLFLDARGAAGCDTLRHVSCGGEVLTQDLRALAGRVLPATTLHNIYALSEAPLVTHWRCRPDDVGVSPMGSAIDGVRLLVLGDDGEPAPPGTTGELLVGGPGIASGYLGGDPADQERFVADRWPGATSALLYRTGDRVVADPGAGSDQDPVLRYVGRRDQRVKVHGYRIELGDIETATAALPGVTNVVVLAEDVRGGDHDLVMYVAAEAASLTPADVQAGLRRTLPAYMVPPRVHVLDRFPMMPNGKVDRAALPARTARPAPPPAPAAPADGVTDGRTDGRMDGLARRVTEEWCAVLGSATGAADESFFAAGGDSLAAMRLANRLQVVIDEAGRTGSAAGGDPDDTGDAVISVHTVIGHPVLRDLVEAVRAARGRAPASWEEGTL